MVTMLGGEMLEFHGGIVDPLCAVTFLVHLVTSQASLLGLTILAVLATKNSAS